ncbi:PBP1A family penicillin-binding protein [Bacillus sp. 165]|uniref:transglycosylase domain-containing protein n=1 Tax=Bacillus sp. 165 TaxID=1529117 RepID=UPI001ADBB5DE|nr:PBP1A family penicillin-binding protein [Bacillus sp. 165]MBO9128722.1 PBP1A family penicillin-binding protein [Bacillus sp. 165]
MIGYLFIVAIGNYVIDDKKLVFNSASKIVDERGEEISKLYLENREIVSIDKIPLPVQQAFIAVEDARFYEHHGLDFKSIFRALYKDLAAGGKVEGASTITQQLAKNIFLTNEKTLLRKTKEMVIALNLERRYTKDQLLEMYLNQIYFGHGAYGIQAAADIYFNKDTADLTVDEGALLAGLLKAPASYSPIYNSNKSKQRRDLVLSLMEQAGYITPEEAVRFQGKTIYLNRKEREREQAYRTYVDMVFQEAATRYGLSNEEVLRGGYKIVVAMNSKIQKTAYQLFQEKKYFPGTDDKVEGAFLLMDSKTGGIVAAVGGRSYAERGLNRIYVKRQPGSVIKPLIVYAPALETGVYTPYSLLPNERLSFDGYIPRNHNNQYSKDITMYDAVTTSANVPAVWLLNEIGIESGKQYLDYGEVHLQDNGLSLALGGLSEGVSPFDMVKLYRAFSARGKIIEPHVITQILQRNGEPINKPDIKEIKIFSPQTAWTMTKMLEGVVKEGTAKRGEYIGALAGKTGTTSLINSREGAKDAWFVGYTPQMVGAVWMGYDKTDSRHHLIGGSGYTAALFKKILTASQVKPLEMFVKPKGVMDVEKPIRLERVTDLKAKWTFTPLGLFTVKLTWTPPQDKRIQYRIYKIEGKKASQIDVVTGTGSYKAKYINIFSVPKFYIVPFNKQTNKPGPRSKVLQP